MIYILITDYIYDQVLRATAANKMISIIAGYTNHVVIDEDILAFRAAYFDSILLRDETIGRMLIDEACFEDYTQIFGQISSRKDWVDANDLIEKDRFPQEIAFGKK